MEEADRALLEEEVEEWLGPIKESMAMAMFYQEFAKISELIEAGFNVNELRADLGLTIRTGYLPLPPEFQGTNFVRYEKYYTPDVYNFNPPDSKLIYNPANGKIYNPYRKIVWGEPGEGVKEGEEYPDRLLYFTEQEYEAEGRESIPWTILHLAVCYAKDEGLIKYLLSKGADPKIRDITSKTALDVAKLLKKDQFVKLLESV